MDVKLFIKVSIISINASKWHVYLMYLDNSQTFLWQQLGGILTF